MSVHDPILKRLRMLKLLGIGNTASDFRAE